MTERLMTAREVADWLNLSTSSILDWFEAGQLPGFKVGRAVRFKESELVAWLETGCRGPRPANVLNGKVLVDAERPPVDATNTGKAR
jgi:excisionase family DNA binding protein